MFGQKHRIFRSIFSRHTYREAQKPKITNEMRQTKQFANEIQ